MKIFKKFLAALIAAVMALGVFAFAACDDGKTGENEGDGEGPGGNAPTTAQLLTAVKSQQIKYFEVSASSSTSTVSPATVLSEDSYNAKFNLDDYDADIKSYSAVSDGTELVKDYNYDFVRGGYVFNNVSYESLNKGEVEPENFSAIPLSFTPEAGVDSTMIAAVPAVINNANYALLSFADVAGALTVSGGKATVDLNKAIYNVVKDVEAVVNRLEETTTVGDILNNENIRKYLSVFTEMIPATTVAAGVAMLPGLVDMLTGLDLSDETVAAQFGELAGYIGMAQALLTGVSFDDFAAVVPDAGSATYDYILKLLGSDALKGIANKLFENFMAMMGGEGGGEPVSAQAEEGGEEMLPKITDISVGFILEMLNAGKDESEKLQLSNLKKNFQAMTANVSETQMYFAMPGFGTDNENQEGPDAQSAASSSAPALSCLSGAKIEYNLNGAAITAQSVSASISSEVEGVAVVSEYSAGVTYSSVKYQLADISGNTVWYMPQDYATGTTVSFHQANEIRDESGIYGGNWVTFTVEFKDGVADPETLKVYNVDFNDPVRYALDPATEIFADADGFYTVDAYAPKLDGEGQPVYGEYGQPVYDKTQTRGVKFTLEVTDGGIVTQEYIDGLDYTPGWDCIGEQYVEAVLTVDHAQKCGWIGGQLSGKVSDLLAHLQSRVTPQS